MRLSVIVPVYNEEKTLAELVERVCRVPLAKEIILVDDGSTDGSREILRRIEAQYRRQPVPGNDVKIVLKERNEGKGSSIREGLRNVTGDAVIIQDADLEYDPMDWLELLKPIRTGQADVVYGSRVLRKGNRKSALSFYLGGRLLSWLTNLLYGARITDEPTCYKMFRSRVIRSIPLKCRGFEFCPEVTAKVLKRGYRIREMPIRYEPRSIREGKKIRWKDGAVAIWTLLRYRFVD